MKAKILGLMRYHATDSRLRHLITILLFQVILFTAVIYIMIPLLEGHHLTLSQSLFFVIESMTTIGYDPVFSMTNPATHILVVVIMITGVGMVLMLIPAIIGPYLSDFLIADPPKKAPFELKNHVVIVGFSEISKAVVESLMVSETDIVVIEEDRDLAKETFTKYHRFVYVIWGDYHDAETWRAGYVQNARYIVTCEDERTSATIVLGLKELTSAKIISVLDDLSFDRYIRYAGADVILSPKNSVGRTLAHHAALKPDIEMLPDVPDSGRFLSLPPEGYELSLVSIPVMEGCRAVGRRIRELALAERYGIRILFYWKLGTFHTSIDADEMIDSSTMLVVLGRGEEIRKALAADFHPIEAGEASVVIAGYGDVGKAAYAGLEGTRLKCLVVDPKPQEVPHIVGNAEEEGVLKKAGIEEARYCIVAVNNDDVNIFTTLIARNMNPGIRIIARANEPISVDRLYRAGADYVALLPAIAGETIGDIILSDTVIVLYNLPDGRKALMKKLTKYNQMGVEQIEKKSRVKIIGIEGRDGPLVAPGPKEYARRNDALFVIGRTEDLRRFVRQF